MTWALIIVAWINGSVTVNTDLRFDNKKLCEEAKAITTQKNDQFGVPRMVSDCIVMRKDQQP